MKPVSRLYDQVAYRRRQILWALDRWGGLSLAILALPWLHGSALSCLSATVFPIASAVVTLTAGLLIQVAMSRLAYEVAEIDLSLQTTTQTTTVGPNAEDPAWDRLTPFEQFFANLNFEVWLVGSFVGTLLIAAAADAIALRHVAGC